MSRLLFLCVLLSPSLITAAEPVYDVVIYGGTSGGVAAAVQTTRMGKSVVLIEPSRHLGGLTTGGLGQTDIGNKKAIGGIAREFYGLVWQHYSAPKAWTHETADKYRPRARRAIDADTRTMWTFEPHVAEAIVGRLLAEAKAPVVLGQRLDLKSGVQKEGARIVAITMESGKKFQGKMFIDATYEGDLMAKAGVSYTVGREANATYGETLNGVQTRQAKYHQFVKPVDPFVKPGDPASGLLPGVHAGGPGEEGQGDKRVQAYNYRLCTTDVPENRVDWPKPDGYDPLRYELLLRNFEAGDLRVPWLIGWMPNRKTDTNNSLAVSTDNIGMNYDYPDGDYATREKIIQEHERYQKGLLWTLANSPRVPASVRYHFRNLGLAKDEFLDNGHWPHQLYVREARRMIGPCVMTENHVRGRLKVDDPIGLAAYTMDSHHTQRYVSPQGKAINEGDVEVGGFPPYSISYRAIVPEQTQCVNLLVPVCLSASHIAYGSIRMEPVFMITGQSAATAAVQAIDQKTNVQTIDYSKLRERLLADGQLLEWAPPKPAPAPKATTLYVAPNGNDAWSGALPTPNAQASDGPLATLTAARDAIRRLKARPEGLSAPVRVRIRAGTYALTDPFTLGPEDSGAERCPITYEAYPGERPVFSGGQRIAGTASGQGELLRATLPEVASGAWRFRSLFSAGRRMIRARCPNLDPSDPYRKGFFYTAHDPNSFGHSVGCIHNRGDWLEYTVRIPADGQYAFWIRYGSANAPNGPQDMAGRLAISIDDQPQIPLANLPDTGGWSSFQWSHAATVRLAQGEHRLRWHNTAGGGCNLMGYILCDDLQWKPKGNSSLQPPSAKHLVIIAADRFVKHHAPQLQLAAGQEGSPHEIYHAPGTFKPAWTRAPEAELHVFQSGSCRAFKEIVSIARLDEAARRVTLSGEECVAPLNPGDRYFVENVAEELDAPGEWHLDRKMGVLAWWPLDKRPESAVVVAPRLGRLVQLLGNARQDKPVRSVRFSGLTFQETDYAPDDGCVGYGMGNDGVVYLKDAVGCEVTNCTFRQIGKYGVCLAGGLENAIRGNDLEDSAEGGVLLLNSAQNAVSDNHIHHLGAVYKHIGGVVLEGAGCNDNLVDHNLVHDSSRYGISLKNPGRRNRIEYNRVLNTNLETFDTGGIEVTQSDKAFLSHSLIHGNVVGDTIGYSSVETKPVFMSWGIYLDSFAGGYTVTGNVVYRTASGGLMLQGGRGNHVENNIFVGGHSNQAHLSNFLKNSSDLVLRRNIFAYTAPDAVLFSTGYLTPQVLQADHNLYSPPYGKTPAFRGVASSFAQWQARGFDTDSVVADPGFVAPERDDYSLRDASPAWKLGFQPIDAAKAGLLRPRCRCEIRPLAPEYGL